MKAAKPREHGALRLPSWKATVLCCYGDCDATAETTAYARIAGPVFFKMPPGWTHEERRGYDPFNNRTHLREEWDAGYRCPLHPEDKFPGPTYEEEA